jgi:hypothetical protein
MYVKCVSGQAQEPQPRLMIDHTARHPTAPCRFGATNPVELTVVRYAQINQCGAGRTGRPPREAAHCKLACANAGQLAFLLVPDSRSPTLAVPNGAGPPPPPPRVLRAVVTRHRLKAGIIRHPLKTAVKRGHLEAVRLQKPRLSSLPSTVELDRADVGD